MALICLQGRDREVMEPATTLDEMDAGEQDLKEIKMDPERQEAIDKYLQLEKKKRLLYSPTFDYVVF